MCIIRLMGSILLQTCLISLYRYSDVSCDSLGIFYIAVVVKVVTKHDISCAESLSWCIEHSSPSKAVCGGVGNSACGGG